MREKRKNGVGGGRGKGEREEGMKRERRPLAAQRI